MIDHDVADQEHRAQCAECGAVWADLERITVEARALPTLSPSRDLWAGIEARLGGVPQRSAPRPRRAHAPRTVRTWLGIPAVRLATAASLLVASTASLTWWVTARSAVNSSPLALAPSGSGSAGDGASAGLGVVTPVALAPEFGPMDREIAALQQLVAERRADLDPATVSVLERNLTLIDQAIAESRAALINDPASRFLATQLARSYGSKLTLLRGIATLPAGT